MVVSCVFDCVLYAMVVSVVVCVRYAMVVSGVF